MREVQQVHSQSLTLAYYALLLDQFSVLALLLRIF